MEKVGNTPLVSIKMKEFENINLYTKLETYNPTGSVKDRAASYILRKLLSTDKISQNTTIIESTSGNFGVALSAYCKYYGLPFIAVVDPNITLINEMLIVSNGAEIVKVDHPDEYGGYLLNRIEKVKELQSQIHDSYWVNQYENPLNANAYYQSLGKELCFQIEEIDYIFIGVSSGGTITGVSRKIKENFPNAKVVAVDVEGSVIFKGQSQKRYIPGIGSSMKPKILKRAKIDEVIITDEVSTINACLELLRNYSFYVGGSSGSAFAAIKQYFKQNKPDRPVNVVTIFPDRGERYFDTIYDPKWVERIKDIKDIRSLEKENTIIY